MPLPRDDCRRRRPGHETAPPQRGRRRLGRRVGIGYNYTLSGAPRWHEVRIRADPRVPRRTRIAPYTDQAGRLQVVRRSDHHRNPRTARRDRRSERLRQIQRHRRRALGARRVEGLRTSRRVDAGRHLQRCGRTCAGRAGLGRALLRQQPGPHRRPVGQLRRTVDQARADPRRRFDLLHQQHPGPSPRYPRPVPGHGTRPPRLRHHRAGHDRPGHRGEARGAARVPRGSGRGVEVPRTAQGDGKPHRRCAGQPRAGRRYPRRARRADRKACRTGRDRNAVSRTRGTAQTGPASAVVCQAAGCRPSAREAQQRNGEPRRGAGGAALGTARGGEPGGNLARRAVSRRRRAARPTGRVLRRQCRGDPPGTAAAVRA